MPRQLICCLFLGLACVLTACGSSPPASSSSVRTPSTNRAQLTTVDWANATYSASCYGSTHIFSTRNWQATTQNIHFQAYPPVFGDLTGDGQPEAAVPYSCAAADVSGVRVLIYTRNNARTTLLGDLPLPEQNHLSRPWSVTHVAINNETLQLTGSGYSPKAPRCCPDLQIQASYRWDRNKFVNTYFTVTPLLSH